MILSVFMTTYTKRLLLSREVNRQNLHSIIIEIIIIANYFYTLSNKQKYSSVLTSILVVHWPQQFITKAVQIFTLPVPIVYIRM